MHSPFLFKVASVAATVAVATTTSAVMTPEAQALTITRTVNGVDYYVTTVEGTFNGLESSLRSQPWWNDVNLARSFAIQVGNALGYPNYPGQFVLYGPLFAYQRRQTYDGKNVYVDGIIHRRLDTGSFPTRSKSLGETLTFATARAVLNDPIVDFSDNPISFNFEEAFGEVEIQSTPMQTSQANGFSIDELSYLLTSKSTNPISFSWSASRDFSISGGSDIFASTFGSTSLQFTGGAPTNLKFFVEGYINNQDSPFARFSVDNPNIVNGIEFPLDWNITEVITGLTPNTHTLGIVSGIQWTPSATGETLLISSQYGGRATPVPTPALLPGLIGMGVAALRKRNQEEGGSAET